MRLYAENMELNNHRMGEVIRRLRMSKGMQQKELARKAGLDPTRISRYENGHEFPEPANQQKIAHGLGITWAELIAEYEDIEISIGGGRVSEGTADYNREQTKRIVREVLEEITGIIGPKPETEGG